MKALVLTMLLLVEMACACRSQTACALVTYPDNSHAYIDEKGIVLYKENADPLLKEQIFEVSDGMMRIRRNGKFGYISAKGAILIPVELDKAENFHNGLAMARVNKAWCYINHEGKVALKPKYDIINKFYDSLAIVGNGGLYGFINTRGELVVPVEFSRVSYFKNGKAWVLRDGQWGCIDRHGNYIIRPYYQDTQDFSEGYAWVKKDNLWGLIDSLGKYLIAPDERNPLIYAHSATLKSFGTFNSGRLISKTYDKTGYCDASLKKVIPSVFDEADDFEHGMAVACKDGLCGMIGADGKYIIEPAYKAIRYAGNNVFAVKVKNRLWGFIDMKGNWTVPATYQKVYDYEKIN